MRPHHMVRADSPDDFGIMWAPDSGRLAAIGCTSCSSMHMTALQFSDSAHHQHMHTGNTLNSGGAAMSPAGLTVCHSLLGWSPSMRLRSLKVATEGLGFSSLDSCPPQLQTVLPGAQTKLSAIYGIACDMSASATACPAVCVSRHGGRILLQVPDDTTDRDTQARSKLCIGSPQADNCAATLMHVRESRRALHHTAGRHAAVSLNRRMVMA